VILLKKLHFSLAIGKTWVYDLFLPMEAELNAGASNEFSKIIIIFWEYQ